VLIEEDDARSPTAMTNLPGTISLPHMTIRGRQVEELAANRALCGESSPLLLCRRDLHNTRALLRPSGSCSLQRQYWEQLPGLVFHVPERRAAVSSGGCSRRARRAVPRHRLTVVCPALCATGAMHMHVLVSGRTGAP
jgi:hypothetical protein